jgi:hypothetical protein
MHMHMYKRPVYRLPQAVVHEECETDAERELERELAERGNFSPQKDGARSIHRVRTLCAPAGRHNVPDTPPHARRWC